MQKVIVTGGTGYIGSHTIVDLMENGFEVICIDNLSRSNEYALTGIEQITGKKPVFYNIDLCDHKALFNVISELKDITGIIHFAALKSVPESMEKPLLYYSNNMGSLLNILMAIQTYNIPNFVFSSSCSVYGNAEELPVTESSPIKEAESPYAHTKQIGEDIIRNYAKVNPTQNILLRYFNPIGAHPSALIGEIPIDTPSNLAPYITQTAIGKFEKRNKNNCEVFNLGTGNGISVLEAIHAFEKASGIKLNYVLGERRAGDVVAVYANNEKARAELKWTCKYSLEDALLSAWKWELKMKELSL